MSTSVELVRTLRNAISEHIDSCVKYRQRSLLTKRMLDAAIDALAAARQAPAQVPEGWKLVPLKPTQEMCQQGQWKAQEWPKFPLRISPIYAAMLAASPKPGEPR